ncbi:MAG: hypothetical protein KIPDCIKN_01066 [Haliscomenobacter sp.]|nr:hypothetical protein [Haliscomenobacter sp.]
MSKKSIESHFCWVLALALILSYSCDKKSKNQIEKDKLGMSWIFVDESIEGSMFNKVVILELSNGSFPGLSFSNCSNDTHGALSSLIEENDNPFFEMAYGCQRNWTLNRIAPPTYIKKKGFDYFQIEQKGVQPYTDLTMLYRQFKEIIESEITIALFDGKEIIKFSSQEILKKATRFYYIKEEAHIDSLGAKFVW